MRSNRLGFRRRSRHRYSIFPLRGGALSHGEMVRRQLFKFKRTTKCMRNREYLYRLVTVGKTSKSL